MFTFSIACLAYSPTWQKGQNRKLQVDKLLQQQHEFCDTSFKMVFSVILFFFSFKDHAHGIVQEPTVSRLGLKSELQLLAYTTATATSEPRSK